MPLVNLILERDEAISVDTIEHIKKNTIAEFIYYSSYFFLRYLKYCPVYILGNITVFYFFDIQSPT